jgi:hypothetical protein
MVDLKSILGYANNSPYQSAPFLDIQTPQGLIDMSDTPIDLMGVDNRGNKKKMKAYSKNPYKFKGDMVREIPMQMGGNPYVKHLFDYLFEEDEAKPQTTAPSVSELENKDIPNMSINTEQDDLAMDVASSPFQSEENDKARYAFEYYKSKGLEPHIAAGIVGNLMQESGNFRQDVIEGKKYGDNGLAFGIAQWHPERASQFKKWATSSGRNPYTLESQLDYVINEPGESQNALQALKKARTSEEAAYIFAKMYERPKVVDPNRIGYAKSLYPKHKGGLLEKYL